MAWLSIDLTGRPLDPREDIATDLCSAYSVCRRRWVVAGTRRHLQSVRLGLVPVRGRSLR